MAALLLKVLDVTGVENQLLSLAFGDSSSSGGAQKNKGFRVSRHLSPGDWGALAKELVARHRATTSVEAARPKAPPPASMAGRKPLVFLSYASEDRERIIELGRDLEVRGVSVWQDVKDLRGGEGWLSQIADYIKRVDYFVFIQSPNMDARDTSVDASRRGGVYNRELALALDHAMDLGERPFVFYVAFGDCPVRDKLSWLQRQRVDTPEGIEALAGSILERFAAYAKVAPTHPVQAALTTLRQHQRHDLIAAGIRACVVQEPMHPVLRPIGPPTALLSCNVACCCNSPRPAQAGLTAQRRALPAHPPTDGFPQVV